MLTATFTDYIYEEIKGPRGGNKGYKSIPVEVIDELIPAKICGLHTAVELYFRKKDLTRISAPGMGNQAAQLYWDDGTRVMGQWKHGRYGSTSHIEAVEAYADGRIQARSSYASGQIKDQHKYLQGVLDKDGKRFL